MLPDQTFVTVVGHPSQLPKVRLLIESIRVFGGALSNGEVLLYELDPQSASCRDLRSDLVQVLPLATADNLQGYPFSGKVLACADAERRLKAADSSLIWISPDCLVIQPPEALSLSEVDDIALRPVHIRNVGLQAGEPLDPYWEGVHKALDIPIPSYTVESFVNREELRGYFNTHTFSIRPDLGLMQEWADVFEQLVGDQRFQEAACTDFLNRVFLHQVILSTLIVTRIPHDRIRLLPPSYAYPYNLHTSVDLAHRAEDMARLHIIAYEDLSLDPRIIQDIAIGEPLCSWLAGQFG